MNPQDLLMQAAGIEPEKPKAKDPYIGRKLADGREIVGRDVFRGQDVYLIKEGIATVFLPAHEIEGEIRRVERNVQSKAKFDREMRERERREAAEEKARRDLDGFEKTFKSKISLERAVAALDKQVGLSGKYATRRDHMRRLAREGWRVTSGHPEGRRAESPTGTFYMQTGRDGISKIAMDYLAFLTDGEPAAKAATKPKAQRSGLTVKVEASKKNPELVRPLVSGTYRRRQFKPADNPPTVHLGLTDFDNWRWREDLRNRLVATAVDGRATSPAIRKHIGDVAAEAILEYAKAHGFYKANTEPKPKAKKRARPTVQRPIKLPTTRSKYAKYAFSRAVNPAQDLINERPVKGHVTVELAKRIVSEWEQQAHDVDAFADEITERVAYGDVSKRSKAYAGIHEASGMIKELEDEIRKAKA